MSGLNYSLSGRDMLEGCDGKSKIVVYPDLYKYKNLDELLKPHGVIFLLYEFEPKYGHWTMIFKQGDTIEHFDSYNYKPDEEFSFIPEYFRKVNDMMYPQLTKMLYDSGKEIHYNNFELQAEGNNIATCGRHCLVRLMLKDLNIDQYYELMNKIKAEMGLNYDEIVYELTKHLDKS